MPKTNHHRIPQTDWEIHKETIRKLYISEDKSLMGEGGVIELMKQKGFCASKPQYESQFMRWGFKKKLTRETWHIIGRIIKDRDEERLVSHVYANGMNLSDAKVKKETTRYRKCDEDGKCCLKKELPIGVEVRTDQEDVEETIFSFEAQGIHSNSPPIVNSSSRLHDSDSWIVPSNFDWYQLNSPEDINDRIPTGLLNPPTYNDAYNCTSFRDNIHLFPSPLPTPSQEFVEDANLLLSTKSTLEGSPYNPFPIYECSRSSSWPTLLSQFGDTRPLFANIPGLEGPCLIPMNTISLFNLDSPFFREVRALLKTSHPEILASINQTKHLLPSEPGLELQRRSVDMVILKQILYLLMNNFAGSDYAVFDTIFEQVKQFPVSHMKDMLDALPHPYTAAPQQSILTIAIKSDIPALVDVMLQRGIDINRVTCHFGGCDYAPIGLACKFRRLDVVKVLLRAGANPNRTIDQNPGSSPLDLLIGFNDGYFKNESTAPRIVSEILRCLLDAGARVFWHMLTESVFWKSEGLTDVFIRYNRLPVSFKIYDGVLRMCPRDVGRYEAETVTATFRSAFQGFTPADMNPHLNACLYDLFQSASNWGNTSLVDYLQEFGLTPSPSCLCRAVRSNSQVLVKKYISLGVGIHDVVRGIDISRVIERTFPSTVDSFLSEGYLLAHPCPTTPFAEAVRHNRQEMISLFEDWSLSHANSRSTDVSILVLAAAEAGYKDMVRELLPIYMKDGAEDSICTSCLVAAATLAGDHDIVELLMMAGLQPNSLSIAAAILTRNIRFVELFLNSTTSFRVDTMNAYLAVRWGDHDVLRLLINAGVSFDGVETNLRFLYLPSMERSKRVSPLQEAISRGEREVVQLLLENGVHLNGHFPMNCKSPLTHAVKRGDEPLVQSLLDHGADSNDPYALQVATKKSYKLTKVILASFWQRYPKGNKTFAVPALRDAIKAKDENLIRALAGFTNLNIMEFHQSIHGQGKYTPSLLGEGITTGSIDIVKLLLEFDGNPDSTVEISDRGRLNAVSKAISTGNLEMVKLLHTAGANLNFSAKLRITRTALQLAVELGHLEIAEYLLDQGVDINAPPCIWEGRTALQFAAKTGSVRMAELLLERGSEINAPGSKYQGKTAFELAAEDGRIDMLLWLFHRGVDIVSDGGEQVRKAQDLAEKNGQIAAKDLVRELGAGAHQRTFSTLGNGFLYTGVEALI